MSRKHEENDLPGSGTAGLIDGNAANEGLAMTRVCLYSRISTDDEHQPTSLTTQRERLERFCEAMGDWRIVAAHEDQASGTSLDRAGLQAALDLAREKRIDLLLVYRVDRLSRKVRQLASLCEELDQLDVVLKSVTEPFDTGSPAGRMMLQMLGVFAEFEHATIVDRVTAGLERRVREGKWMSGRLPYGYTRDKDTKLLAPDPVKAPVVRRIFHLYADRKLGTTAIARTLEAEAAPPPRKQGWSPNALQLILANPAYKGLVRWNGETHPGLHEPLVDDDTFDKAQEILRRRGEDASLRRGNPSDFLLSGLVRCHHCGRAYVGTSAHGRNGRYTYYACSTRYKYGPTKCQGDRLPKDRLEAAVLTQLADLYRDGRVIERALANLADATQSERPELEDQLASTRAEITRVEGKLERYFEGFESGNLATDVFQDRIRGHRGRLETLREREADLTARLATHAQTPPDEAALTGLADQLETIIANESPEQAKELLRLLVKDIQVHDRRRIIPTYRIPAAVRAIPRKVGGTGLEPVTPSLSSWCSPN
jgi:site-specific DNA recombinase